MFLANMVVQGAIIFGLIIIFLLSVVLNKKTKAPEGVEVPEKCSSCVSETCIIKVSTVEEIKKEMKELVYNCEENIDEKK